jgi:hypothetical protein
MLGIGSIMKLIRKDTVLAKWSVLVMVGIVAVAVTAGCKSNEDATTPAAVKSALGSGTLTPAQKAQFDANQAAARKQGEAMAKAHGMSGVPSN